MRTIKISDITLREFANVKDNSLTFKEKLEIVKSLDKIKVDTIELPPIIDKKTDKLINKTASNGTKAILRAVVGNTIESVEETWETIKTAKKPALHVMLPVSSVGMEYSYHKKAPAMLKLIEDVVSKCSSLCNDVEFSALDATRAEKDFLVSAINTAIKAGAKNITVCDSAGIKLPKEFEEFINGLYTDIPELKNLNFMVQVSNEMNMAVACIASAIDAGVSGVKTTISKMGYATIWETVHFMQVKGPEMQISVNVASTQLARAVKQMKWTIQTKKSEISPFDNKVSEPMTDEKLDISADIAKVNKVIKTMGYELSEEDNNRVYEEFLRVARRKPFVGSEEIEAIIASSTLQVPSTYRIDSYVINSGNIITATANITLEKEGKKFNGVSIGAGPIDAAILAIEHIIGHHYELDDFQIQAVTEGKEAMGSALVKLRSNGKLYSGNGISTDIIGAAIRAYINALNKIVYEEG